MCACIRELQSGEVETFWVKYEAVTGIGLKLLLW